MKTYVITLAPPRLPFPLLACNTYFKTVITYGRATLWI